MKKDTTKLIKKVITNKKGIQQTVYVAPEGLQKNWLNSFMSFFYFKDKTSAVQKIEDDYKQNNIDKYGVSIESWKDHLSEYFIHKDKWDKFFGHKKTNGTATGSGSKKGEGETKTTSGGGEKKPVKFNLSLMKLIHNMYHTRPDKPVITPKPKETKNTSSGKRKKQLVSPTDEDIKQIKENESRESREGYFNEKPAEILNAGADVWGARRHNYTTYENVSADISSMEKDGTAIAYVTKKNLFGEFGIANKDERIEKGETHLKVLMSYYIKDCLAKMPPDDPEARSKYMEFCRSIQQFEQDTKNHIEYITALAESFINIYPLKDNSGYSYIPDAHVIESVGKPLAKFLYTLNEKTEVNGLFRGSLDKKEREKNKILEDIYRASDSHDKAEYDYLLRRIFGASKLMDFKIKKGDNVVFTDGLAEKERDIIVKKTSFENRDERNLYDQNNFSKLFSDRMYTKLLDETRERYWDWPETGETYKLLRVYTNSRTGENHTETEEATIINYDADNFIKYKRGDGSIGFISSTEFDRGERGRIDTDPAIQNQSLLERVNNSFNQNFKNNEEAAQFFKERMQRFDEERMKHIKLEILKPIGTGQVVKVKKDQLHVTFKYSDYSRTFAISPESLQAENVESVKRTMTTAGVFKPDLYVESKVERIGGENFDGLSIEQMQQKLTGEVKMKALQYGNSMPTAERQYHTQWALQSMSDLSDILGLPIEQITAMGKLGMAFGARGQAGKGRGALAHYEPGTKMINLTRATGFGSLAHEWGHFIDNILAQNSGGIKFLSDSPPTEKKFFSSETEIPHGAIMTRISGNKTERYFFDKNYPRQQYPWAKLVSGQTEPDPKSRHYSFYWGSGKGVDVPQLDGVHGLIYQIAQNSRESLQKQGENIPAVKEDKYLNTPTECFARAFESYVADKLEDNGRKNTYLSSKAKTIGRDGNIVYPQNAYRSKSNELFDKLFEELRKTNTLQKAIEKYFRKNIILIKLKKSTGDNKYRRIS